MRHGLAGLLMLVALPATAQVPTLDGDWDGALSPGAGILLRLALHVENHDGATSAIMTSIDQGNAQMSVSAVTQDGAAVTLDVARVHGSFKGVLSDDGQTLSGTWTQGAPMPLSFARRAPGASPPAPLRRPQQPEPPFPYQSQDVSFPGPTGITLAGTLTIPEGSGPFPAVVLVQGSGPHDRDETILGHEPFLLLADTLTRRGIAVLRMDKRGVAKSGGDYPSATSTDFAADVAASITWLRARPDINGRKIGLVGHSEGGMIAPMVAADDPKLAFLVLMAGPGLTGEEILTRQRRLIAQAMGVSTEIQDKAEARGKVMFEIARTARDTADAQTRIVAALTADGVPAAAADAAARQIASPWFRYFLSYDPVPTLRRVRCPVLAINGSLDLQVPPKEDLAAIKAALANDHDVTVTELPGLNHLFQTAKTGAPGEYQQIEETIAPSALAVIGDWVVQHAR